VNSCRWEVRVGQRVYPGHGPAATVRLSRVVPRPPAGRWDIGEGEESSVCFRKGPTLTPNCGQAHRAADRGPERPRAGAGGPTRRPTASGGFRFSLAPGQVTAPGAAGLAVGAPGVVFTTPATAPGLFGTVTTAPGLFGTPTAAGVGFGTAATAPGVFGGATTGRTGF
jgi:hypothetical protein